LHEPFKTVKSVRISKFIRQRVPDTLIVLFTYFTLRKECLWFQTQAQEQSVFRPISRLTSLPISTYSHVVGLLCSSYATFWTHGFAGLVAPKECYILYALHSTQDDTVILLLTCCWS